MDGQSTHKITDNNLHLAVQYLVKYLLNDSYLDRYDNFEECFDAAIGIAGGLSIYPRIGDLCHVVYFRGRRAEVHGKDNTTYHIKPKDFTNAAKAYWNEKKVKAKQTSMDF